MFFLGQPRAEMFSLRRGYPCQAPGSPRGLGLNMGSIYGNNRTGTKVWLPHRKEKPVGRECQGKGKAGRYGMNILLTRQWRSKLWSAQDSDREPGTEESVKALNFLVLTQHLRHSAVNGWLTQAVPSYKYLYYGFGRISGEVLEMGHCLSFRLQFGKVYYSSKSDLSLYSLTWANRTKTLRLGGSNVSYAKERVGKKSDDALPSSKAFNVASHRYSEIEWENTCINRGWIDPLKLEFDFVAAFISKNILLQVITS